MQEERKEIKKQDREEINQKEESRKRKRNYPVAKFAFARGTKENMLYETEKKNWDKPPKHFLPVHENTKAIVYLEGCFRRPL